jgi:hypothetical protein
MMETGEPVHFRRDAMVLTDKGEIPAAMLHAAVGASIVSKKFATGEAA